MARTPSARRLARMTPLAAAGLAAASLAAAAPAGAASFPTDGGLIAFSEYGKGASTIWSDGTHRTAVTELPSAAVVGTWDAAGRRLSAIASGNPDALVLDHVTRTTSAYAGPAGTDVNGAAFAPRGAGMAVATYSDLWITRPGDADVKVEFGDQAGDVEWSSESDEGTLVWDRGNFGGIGIRNASGIVATLAPGAYNPSISRDGKVVSYSFDDDVYVIGTEPGSVATRVPAMTGESEWMSALSPDGTQVVYARQDFTSVTPSGASLWSAPVDGSAPARKLGPVDNITGIAWQPATAVKAGTVAIDQAGAPSVGVKLTATAVPGVGGDEPQVEAYAWERCPVVPPDAGGCTDVGTGAEYTVQAADEGHRLRVRHAVTNPAGTVEVRSALTPAVTGPDTERPEQPTLVEPVKLTSDARPSFAFTGAEAGGTFECRITPGGLGDADALPSFAPCTSPYTTDALTSGQWVLELRQIDAALNKGVVRTHVFDVDLDAPATPELVAQQVRGLSASVSFTGGSSEHVTFECRLDAPLDESGPSWTPCPGAWSADDLAEGPHRLEIRAVDKAGNRSLPAIATWTSKKPAPPAVVEQPTPEAQPQTPAAEAPAVPTPAAAATAKPAAPTAPAAPATPAAKPATTAPRPATLTAVIGAAKPGPSSGTSSAATIEVAKQAVGVGCSITGTVLRSCTVELYATAATGASARAAAAKQVLVGTGAYTAAAGASKLDVKVTLNATGKAMLRRSPAGLRVSVRITGRPVAGTPLKATGAAKLVTDGASLTVGGFAQRSAALTPAAKRQLRALAKFGKAASVRCVGHTDASSDDARYLRALGERRARAVCGFLVQLGLRADTRTLVSKADAAPVATNATDAGRARNRRVQVTLVR